MKMKGIVAAACAVVLSASLALVAVGCGGKADSVAATVGDKKIMESEVTTYIENMRASYGAEDDSTWAMYLQFYFQSADALRENVIDSLINRQLVFLIADDLGLKADPAVVDEHINTIKANYNSEEAWKNALTNAGLTEESYRELIEYNLLLTELRKTLAPSDKPSDQDILKLASENANLFDGAKRVSHILFAATDEETAKTVLAKINAGELDFAEAAKQYSTDTVSAEQGGDCGWDALATFVSEFQEGLDALEKGQVSELVQSQFGYHIIKCTDVFEAPAELKSLDQLPKEFAEFFTKLANSSTIDEVFADWISAHKKQYEVKINEKPSGLSYDIDVDKAMALANAGAEDEESESSASGEASTEASSEASTEASAAASTSAS